MYKILIFTLFGLFTGVVGTGVGGIIACIKKIDSPKIISSIMEFSAGLMLGIVCFELLPSALNVENTIPIYSVFGFFAGVISMFLLLSKRYKSHDCSKGNTNFERLTASMLIGIIVHNFPEGLSIGTGFDIDVFLGSSLMIAIFLHNIPEGVALAVAAKNSGKSNAKAVLITAMSGIPIGIGAFIGAVIGRIDPFWTAISLSFAGGSMAYLVLFEILPETKNIYNGRLPKIMCILGFTVAVILTIVLE